MPSASRIAESLTWYWFNTRFACGAVIADGDRIVDACPIYRRWIGGSLKRLTAYYRAEVIRIRTPF